MGHFCNADATITPVGSYQIDRWMFLYEAYFVLLPTMYFQGPVCGRRCLGQRSLGCGLLLHVDSPRFVGSRRISRDRLLVRSGMSKKSLP